MCVFVIVARETDVTRNRKQNVVVVFYDTCSYEKKYSRLSFFFRFNLKTSDKQQLKKELRTKRRA